MKNKPIYVSFANPKLEKVYEKLNQGTYEEKKLHTHIQKAIQELKKNPTCGMKITKSLWPKNYIQKFQIANLWKYDLPDGWRLIYTIFQNQTMILNVILEWFSHKKYEQKFRY